MNRDEIAEYVMKNKVERKLKGWEASCPVCAKPFETTSTAQLIARMQEHMRTHEGENGN